MKLHSQTALITNSSSVIYSHVDDTSIDLFKKMIDGILEKAGCTKRADDLYEFHVDFEFPDDVAFEAQNIFNIEDKDEALEKARSLLGTPEVDRLHDTYSYRIPNTTFYAIDKSSGERVDFGKNILNIFSLEGGFDG